MAKVGLRVDLFPLAMVRVSPFGRFEKQLINQALGNVHEKRKGRLRKDPLSIYEKIGELKLILN